MAYDESNIRTLSSIEHIRQRPGMYIGRLGSGAHPDDGIYILLKEVIDNAIDEFMEGNGNRIVVTQEGQKCSVRDYGRGIPLNKLIECVSVINTGAKYDNEAFQYSVGLNGVGTKAVNALSKYFEITSWREGEYMHAVFERGKLKEKKRGKGDEPNGTFVAFIPDDDPSIFGSYSYNEDFIRERLWNYAYLNKGLTMVFNGKIIRSQNGLTDLVRKILGEDGLYPLINFKNNHLEFSFTHTNGYGESYRSYVNGQYTSDGGTHEAAFKEGILKGINEFYHKSWAAPEIRDGIVATIAIKVMNPVFESQTKNKLGNTDVRSWIVPEVKEAVIDCLMKNKDIAKGLEDKIINNEKVHKEEAAVRNGAKEKAKRVSINIPKLKECRYHLNSASQAHREEAEKSMIFLTEGDSAAGTITQARNSDYQAVFALRGKILNVQGKNRTEIYKNEELYNMMIALGIEESMDNLRYGKVVIATDADVDGFHIRILIMTYFFTYFEELIEQGRLYILETPLFRVRNKKENVYCYSEEERDEALKVVKSAEVTRFKGLGEIRSEEFKKFIGDEIKLVPVTYDSLREIRQEMEFYMGDNTPERRDFIMENLLDGQS
ncbi:MAG: DNA topoisomerase IV subunit B [Candidatus Ornithospirochaeta sp.]|nr:DNA topoisomerase IV subunit B [Sphaerochaetaceae bacterium]MDY5524198.1 DNA topoisomerase IV subunit B [Candidatus Ornithospirochaeta sp.]